MLLEQKKLKIYLYTKSLCKMFYKSAKYLNKEELNKEEKRLKTKKC